MKRMKGAVFRHVPLIDTATHGANTWLADDDIHVLRLQASQHRQLASRRAFRVVNQNMAATRAAHRERRSRNDVVRVKAAFNYEPASGVPV